TRPASDTLILDSDPSNTRNVEKALEKSVTYQSGYNDTVQQGVSIDGKVPATSSEVSAFSTATLLAMGTEDTSAAGTGVLANGLISTATVLMIEDAVSCVTYPLKFEIGSRLIPGTNTTIPFVTASQAYRNNPDIFNIIESVF
ncbi:hypothetical protein BaRGS_00024212, partial [Batillaria attramentaria]